MSTAALLDPQPHAREGSRGPAGLPRLLQRAPSRGAMSLAEHVMVHGPAPLLRRRSRRSEHPLIELVERAGLRGRGGAAFPTAAKLRAVARSRRRAVVVVNATEGEPASRKDRTLTRTLPHLVLDGATLAAEALGSAEVIVGVCASASASAESLAAAIAERGSPRRSPVRIQLRVVPEHYLAGQETALVNHLGGGPALPTFTPPMPFQQGVARRPTLVSNAETFAHVALIARHGPDWFRELGTPSQPGSTLVTLSGAVAHPGVFEIEVGASLHSLIDAAGGATARLRAALLGGYGGSWVAGEQLRKLALADEHLAPLGASLGAGVVLALSEHACPVAESARIVRWLAASSAGQCGPCVHGLDALATSFEELAGGVAQADAGRRIAQLAALVQGRGACRHPDGVARLALSALDTFAPELADHARYGPCERCAAPPELPLPARESRR
ncbi:MAG TPA: NADH-ubiquinone oxidoreductase-F iron-sulfur binding region domain-containing protein [Solirubrobacteraceae bacterium]|nr:NADH-ubiquinone oxidoreductase-F iron-sulfur binding region domain-containing protein [Solirubrobacteraceae bacterium]